MGQQQLLLLVLGIVIVGLAVVVGIQAFGENQKKANSDAMTNDVIRIASDAQAWNLKPTAFGGGNGSFTNVSFEKLGYAASGTGAASTYGNLNADYRIIGTPGATVVIQGCKVGTGNLVQATVSGTGPGDITTLVKNVTACAFTLQS